MKPALRFSLIAGVTSFVGPACAFIYERGYIILIGDSLFDMWVLVAIAALGVGIGGFSVLRGARVAGVICILTNVPVLALYGFIAAFFALGGTR